MHLNVPNVSSTSQKWTTTTSETNRLLEIQNAAKSIGVSGRGTHIIVTEGHLYFSYSLPPSLSPPLSNRSPALLLLFNIMAASLPGLFISFLSSLPSHSFLSLSSPLIPLTPPLSPCLPSLLSLPPSG